MKTWTFETKTGLVLLRVSESAGKKTVSTARKASDWGAAFLEKHGIYAKCLLLKNEKGEHMGTIESLAMPHLITALGSSQSRRISMNREVKHERE